MAKILIIEDHDATAELIEMIARSRGHHVMHSSDGSQALDLAKTFNPDLILLDVMLPGMDGFNAQSKLFEDEQTRRIPVIMMTSKAQMEEVFRVAGNVADFLPKPFSVKDLVEKMERILNK